MKHKRILLYVALIGAIAGIASAQTTSVFTTGLNAPSKVILTGQNNLLVSESGTVVPNNGRISLVNGQSGARQTLIDGLPSGIDTNGAPSPSGPAGMKLSGRKLYLVIGPGDSTLQNGRGGQRPNFNPASPIFASVLEITLNADYEENTSGFTLSVNDQTALKNGSTVTLTNAQAKQINLRMLTDLPDYRAEQLGQPYLVRTANPYAAEIVGTDLYVVDASFNSLYKINLANGQFQTFANFAPKPNPLPFGPPFSEAVPDSVHLYGNQLLITYLTGFPFAANLAEVRSVNLGTGAQATFIPNLTTGIDVLPIAIPGDNDLFYVLEYSTAFLAMPQGPGRLKLFTSPTAVPIVLNSTLSTPTSMARNPETGDIFITEIFAGRITRVTAVEIVAAFDGF
ncbi:MAG: ScyD/ScyE family protein [Pyrinomonadaceae bacterium]